MQDDRVRTTFSQLLSTPQAAFAAHLTLKSQILKDPSFLSQTLEHLSNSE
jgi:hypothetical protein